MGALLIGSLMIIPPLSAMQICRTLKTTAIVSVVFAFVSAYAGIFLSFTPEFLLARQYQQY